jgi:hypothetical protein
MTLIKRILNLSAIMGNQEPEPVVTPQVQPQAPTAFGIASNPDLFEKPSVSKQVTDTTDGFESANPLRTGIFTFRVSDKLSSMNSKTEIRKSDAQDAEARATEFYRGLQDFLKEMRK